MEQITQFCIQCGKETTHYLKQPPAGKTWKPFYGCANYKSHPAKGQVPIINENAYNVPNQVSSDGLAIVLEEVQAGFKKINDRLDTMGKFLKPKVDLKDIR